MCAVVFSSVICLASLFHLISVSITCKFKIRLFNLVLDYTVFFIAGSYIHLHTAKEKHSNSNLEL